MDNWNGYLNDQEVNDLHAAAINAGLATSDSRIEALLSKMTPRFVAGLSGGGLAPDARLLVQLTYLNRIHNLRDGAVPLVQWLDAAVTLAGDKREADIFEDALDRVRQTPAGATAEAPPGAPLGLHSGRAAIADANLEVRPEAIVAGDEMLGVGFLAGGLAASKSVVKLLVHRHVEGEGIFLAGDRPMLSNGTGWYIGPGLVITNHHVINARRGFPPPGEPEATTDDFRLQAESIKILLDYLDDKKPTLSVESQAGALQAADKDLDFTIIRVPTEAQNRPPLKLRNHPIRKRAEQALGTRVNILQHPNGGPMRLGFRDNFVVTGDDNGLDYLTDTDFGSSGSPVFDDAWSVAALHSSSVNVSDDDLQIRGHKVRRQNHGTAITLILKHLKDNHPDLHAEILAGQN